MRYLCEAAGIPADVTFYWAGPSPSKRTHYWYGFDDYLERCRRGERGPATFRLQAPREGRAVADPHFLYHAVTTVQGVHYDPSYGRVGLPPVLESEPNSVPQTGPVRPTGNNIVKSCWSCDHPREFLGACD